MSPHERFRLWVEQRQRAGVSRSEIAVQLGCDSTLISKLLRGARRPGGKIAVAIEAATGGLIPVRDWYYERGAA